MPRMLRDQYGRSARDLRVSLTDRCNLRCQYCMPEEGLPLLPLTKILSDDEVIRMVRIGVELLGITTVRFTGGEPLLRKGLERIVEETAKLDTVDGGHPDISLTTNALGLAHRAQALRDAGLRRVNISLDSSSQEEYFSLTRRDRFQHALDGIRAAVSAGLSPVKINAVVMPGVNDHSVGQLLSLSLRLGAQLRFIEYMPIGPRGQWNKDEMITSQALIDQLSQHFDLSAVQETQRGSSPAALWNVQPGSFRGIPHDGGQVGFISSVSQPFCAQCDRTRLTAEGSIRSCLFSDDEYDVRTLLRSGASDQQIAAVWQSAMWAKPASHGINDEGFIPPERNMSSIGG
ncbi:GTP 3',8-cyclase MoaA [Arcanobacterium buesumense]|uniref:GTP 3',8-cyclase n=1 Tax=Arcanobacterium buesumense TaxID=2722751 RepID=A0A6H2ENQ5_9ACTO|nr:GTP 3',8-cyclase MoaA [Arcanobacterium buesumense]